MGSLGAVLEEPLVFASFSLCGGDTIAGRNSVRGEGLSQLFVQGMQPLMAGRGDTEGLLTRGAEA